jgi:hypothetical protein
MSAFQNCAPFRASTNSKGSSGILSFAADLKYVPQCVKTAAPPKVSLHRLSNREYQNVIKDWFNVDVPKTSFPSADKVGPSGFSNDYENLNNLGYLGDEVIQNYFNLAIEVADLIMDNNPTTVTSLGCATATDNCYDQIIGKLALHLFRRPLGTVTGDMTLANYRTLLKTPPDKTKGWKLVLVSMLSSPSFMYRTYGSFSAGTGPVGLNRYELASRLSFFIWASGPDQALLDADVTQPDVMNAQVDRMLNDAAKSARLAVSLGDEWTKYGDITVTPIHEDFGVDDNVRQQAKLESREFMKYLFTQSPRFLDFVDADYSFLNKDMADFYGISGVTGTDFKMVSNLGTQRGGMVSQMSVLAASSGGDNDSHPVRRGMWLMNEVMCIKIGDVPPGVDTDPDIPEAKTPREFAAIHAAGTCIGCHGKIDPVGLGLENFDAVGQWRTKYTVGDDWGGKNISVESDGTLLSGKSFNSPDQLKHIIAEDRNTHMCLSSKVMKYAIGRDLGLVDYCDSEKIGDEVVGTQGSFRDVVKRIVATDAFAKGGR